MKQLVAALALAALVATGATASGKPPQPTYTSGEGCTWAWKQGGGLGLWAEDCDFDTGQFRVVFDEQSSSYQLTADGKAQLTVVRIFDKAAAKGPEAVLPALVLQGLVEATDCEFAPSQDQKPERPWTYFDIVPVGKRKQVFDALPNDEVPEPPCGELGLLPDSVGYFAIHKEHPDKLLYLYLGQDGTMFDPLSITFDSR